MQFVLTWVFQHKFWLLIFFLKIFFFQRILTVFIQYSLCNWLDLSISDVIFCIDDQVCTSAEDKITTWPQMYYQIIFQVICFASDWINNMKIDVFEKRTSHFTSQYHVQIAKSNHLIKLNVFELSHEIQVQTHQIRCQTNRLLPTNNKFDMKNMH